MGEKLEIISKTYLSLFYYLLHQNTESGVKTTGDYKTQLTQQLTYFQQKELDHINEYRAEAGSEPVRFDCELAAFAAYRSYMDCTEGWDAHDGLEDMLNSGELYNIMDLAHMGAYSENKETVAGTSETRPAYYAYYTSPGHYKTMIDTEFHYVGCGHYFVSDKDYNWGGTKECNSISFDTYADTTGSQYFD